MRRSVILTRTELGLAGTWNPESRLQQGATRGICTVAKQVGKYTIWWCRHHIAVLCQLVAPIGIAYLLLWLCMGWCREIESPADAISEGWRNAVVNRLPCTVSTYRKAHTQQQVRYRATVFPCTTDADRSLPGHSYCDLPNCH